MLYIGGEAFDRGWAIQCHLRTHEGMYDDSMYTYAMCSIYQWLSTYLYMLYIVLILLYISAV